MRSSCAVATVCTLEAAWTAAVETADVGLIGHVRQTRSAAHLSVATETCSARLDRNVKLLR